MADGRKEEQHAREECASGAQEQRGPEANLLAEQASEEGAEQRGAEAEEAEGGVDAAEEALRSGLFMLVVLDLVGPLQGGRRVSLRDGSVGRRLAHAAEKGEAVALLLGRHRRAGTFAQVGLELVARRARFWGPAGQKTLLDGLELEAGVVRNRNGGSTGQVQLELWAGGGPSHCGR